MSERLKSAQALSAVREADLVKMARVAMLLNDESPAFGSGPRPHRTRAGQGAEFLDFREYQPGEDVRRLDWRISARRGRPYVRTYHDELSADWQISLDRSASMGAPDDGKWMLAVQLAAAFAFLLLQAGHRVGMVQFSRQVDDLCPLGRGRLQYVRIANQLSESVSAPHGGDSRLSTVVSVLRPGAHVIVLSDFLRADAMESDLERLRSPGRRIHAVQLLSPGETELVDPDAPSVLDIESGERVSIAAGAGEAARAELRSLKDSLKAFSLRSGIRLSSCVATDHWRDVMLRHISAFHA